MPSFSTARASHIGSPRAPAIVVGLDCVTGLQTARILADRGVRVIGVASDKGHFSCRTRVCERIEIAPETGESLVEGLVRIGETIDEESVLLPCTDESVREISAHRDRLPSRMHVLLPRHAQVMQLMDKGQFASLAREIGVDVPLTMTLRDRLDAERAADELTYPVVVKPSLKTREWLAAAPSKVLRASQAGELLEIFDRYAHAARGLLVQEWVVGPDSNLFSCNAYFDRKSRPLATFVARKVRQWPPDAGTSSFGEETRNDTVLDMTLRLFTAVGFHGLAYLEVKRDARTGRHLAIEPNVGRPTGRSAIAEAGGVELLLTAYRDALGAALPEQRTQRYRGAKWIYLRHDLQSATKLWRRGELTPMAWLRSVRGVRGDAVWSPRDPLPFVWDVAHTIRKAVPGRRPRRAPARATAILCAPGSARTPDAQ